ncbi:MAG: AbrB family transcriptional regulator [Pseudomonadota bacterium]
MPLFAFGFLGGGASYLIGLPMPFLLGGIVGTGAFVLWYEREDRELPKLSRWVRMVFAALIGAMIGTRFSPELLPLLPQFWVSVPAVAVFILLAHFGNFTIMTRLGGFAKKDSFFAGMPGGIVDSAILAEQAGADLRVVTTQHFIRIILVVSSVPLLFWVIEGSAVGSLAGESLATASYGITDVTLIIVIALAGLFAGRAVGLPVSHLMGPLILGLGLSVAGLIAVDIPGWMQHAAQAMIGVSLGAQFSGVSRAMLLRGLRTGLMSGLYMLGLAAGFASVMIQLVPADFGAMFISFAAGGLAEMSLIALTLNFNPVVVALHHLTRIFFTIWIGHTIWKRVLKEGEKL